MHETPLVRGWEMKKPTEVGLRVVTQNWKYPETEGKPGKQQNARCPAR